MSSMPDLMNFQATTPTRAPSFPVSSLGFRGGMHGSMPGTPLGPRGGYAPMPGTPMGFPPGARMPMPGTPSPYPGGFGLPVVRSANPNAPVSPYMMNVNKRPIPFTNQPPAKRLKKGSDDSDEDESAEDIDEEELDNTDQKERKG